MVRRRNRRRRGNIFSNARNNRAQRRGNNKVVVLRRRPRRNVPKRLPTLGYAAGGTSTTFRAFLTDFTLPKSSTTLNTCYTFTIQSALEKANSFLKIIPTIYTNFQIQQVTFRIISLVGSSTGGMHAVFVLDASMGFPACTSMDFSDVVSRGGSTSGKLWTDLAIDWVPTEPNDLNYQSASSKAIQLMYAVELPAAASSTADLVVAKLIADIRCVARTVNPAAPPKEVCEILGIGKQPERFAGDDIDAEKVSVIIANTQ